MIKKIKIGAVNLKFVLRHKWDKSSREEYYYAFREYNLGVWFKKNKIVSNKNFKNPNEWSNNLVNDYMFGIDLLVVKFWFEFNINGKEFTLT